MRVCGLAALPLIVLPLFGEAGLTSAVVGVGAGQIARINALNLGTRQSASGSACHITAQFLDERAAPLKEKTIEIGVGKSESIDFELDRGGSAKRLEIRALLLFGQIGGAPPGPDARHTADCNILPSLEIFERATGKTSVILTDWKPLPLSDARGVAFAPSIVAEQ